MTCSTAAPDQTSLSLLPAAGTDYIMDFNIYTAGDTDNDDKIDLTAFNTSYSSLAIDDIAGNAVITLPGDDGGTITVLGVTGLSANDFFF